jgi:hypothetical protein
VSTVVGSGREIGQKKAGLSIEIWKMAWFDVKIIKSSDDKRPRISDHRLGSEYILLTRRQVTMVKKLLILLALIVWATPALAGGVTPEDFKAKTTQNLVNLCAASPDDPLYNQAANFCHGYLIGGFHYYHASVLGDKGEKVVCIPKNSSITRNQAVKMFVDWAQAHPQYMQELPVETEFRFLIDKWPCK